MKRSSLFFLLSILLPFGMCAQWSAQNSGTTNALNEITFPAADTGFVAGENGTLLRTYNGGQSWTTLSSGTSKHLTDVFFLNTQTGFVVGDSGYFGKTTDGGTTWTVSYLTSVGQVSLGAVCFTSSQIGYAAGNDGFMFGIIFKTINAGASWTVCNSPTSFMSISYSRLVFPNATVGYALTRGMCMKTIDAGNNWFITDTAYVNSGAMFSILEDAHFFSQDTGYIVGWYNGFTGYTTNGGTNWTDHFVLGTQWYAVDFPSRQVGYLVGWGQLGKTADGGLTWQDITTPLIQSSGIYSMKFTDNNTGYACGINGLILKTTNGGTTGIIAEMSNAVLSVYPNPSSGILRCQVSGIRCQKVEITNVLGECVTADNLIIDNDAVHIDLTGSPSGIYFIRILLEDQTMQTVKVIIE